MKKIILASASPRRKEILNQVGIEFSVDVSDFEEKQEINLSPRAMVKMFSLNKASNIAKRHKNSIIIGADTVVILNNKILGKPKNAEKR